MTSALLPSILITGFSVAFFHAAIPTHWLPFVLAARGQRWSSAKTLAVTALAGLGHVLFTTVLGILVVWLGIKTSHLTGQVFPYLAGVVLILFGLFYLVRQARSGHGHRHWFDHAHNHDHDHNHHGHEHPHDHAHEHAGHVHAYHATSNLKQSDTAVVLGLLALMTFSPCEGFLPVYLSGIRFGWQGFFLLSFILAAATLTGMVLFTALSLAGLQRLRLAVLDKYESAILGGLLVLLGVAVMVLEP
jgi:nickel/cobalt transporter (NicO) family protein